MIGDPCTEVYIRGLHVQMGSDRLALLVVPVIF